MNFNLTVFVVALAFEFLSLWSHGFESPLTPLFSPVVQAEGKVAELNTVSFICTSVQYLQWERDQLTSFLSPLRLHIEFLLYLSNWLEQAKLLRKVS